MGYAILSIQSKIGSLTFMPIGLSYSNREAAQSLSQSSGFNREFQINIGTKDDLDEFLEKKAQSEINSLVARMKKESKSIAVAMYGGEFFVIFSEDLKDPEVFSNGIIPFIEIGDTRKYCTNARFFDYCRVLRRDNGINIDFSDSKK